MTLWAGSATETRTLTGSQAGGNSVAISKSVSYDYNLDGSLFQAPLSQWRDGASIRPGITARGGHAFRKKPSDSGSNINYVTGAADRRPRSSLTRLRQRQRRAGRHHQQLHLQQTSSAAQHVGHVRRPVQTVFSASAMTSMPETERPAAASTTATFAASSITKTQPTAATRRSPMTR